MVSSFQASFGEKANNRRSDTRSTNTNSNSITNTNTNINTNTPSSTPSLSDASDSSAVSAGHSNAHPQPTPSPPSLPSFNLGFGSLSTGMRTGNNRTQTRQMGKTAEKKKTLSFFSFFSQHNSNTDTSTSSSASELNSDSVVSGSNCENAHHSLEGHPSSLHLSAPSSPCLLTQSSPPPYPTISVTQMIEAADLEDDADRELIVDNAVNEQEERLFSSFSGSQNQLLTKEEMDVVLLKEDIGCSHSSRRQSKRLTSAQESESSVSSELVQSNRVHVDELFISCIDEMEANGEFDVLYSYLFHPSESVCFFASSIINTVERCSQSNWNNNLTHH